MRNFIVVILLAVTLTSTQAADRTNFDSNWKFALGDVSGAEQIAFDDSSWRRLNVPHDWSIEGEYSEDNPMGGQCGYLPAGIGWYRKTIDVDPQWRSKHVEITFDGVYMNSTVWANGKKLGNRPYGWSSFTYDISDLTDISDSITFAVRVDNEKQPSARWYTGSGIYAHTWLTVKEKVHVPSDGIFIRTKGNTVRVDTEIINRSAESGRFKLRTSIRDASGKVVTSANQPVALDRDKTGSVNQSMDIPNPSRWSVETPYLYTAVTEVVSSDRVLDRVETRFGVRDLEWKPESGMWLNGKNVKMRGVCNHQDAGALGTAVPDKVLRYRIEQLKAMGCNAIRTSHNPQTPVFYDICDEVGMLVMDEIFDGWMRKANQDYGGRWFNQWWNRDLTDWLRRDRNHPSVVIYSMGNETRGKVGVELVARCHELDPTRPVTSGHSADEAMDILGVNGASEKVGWLDTMNTDKVFIGTENTHTWQVRGFYRSLTWYRDGYPNKKQKPYKTPDLTEKEIFTYDWTDDPGRANGKQRFNSSYDNAMVRLNSRRNIQQLRDIPRYAGSFRWTGYDYLGEAGYVHGGWPFKAFMGGAIDLANFEKDLYYLYQSQWTDEPMVHILPHWTHPVMELGTTIPVWVYSNCDSVELFFNNQSLGKQKPGQAWDEMQCQWMVGWQPGTLKAVGFCDGKPNVEHVIRTADAPAQIALSIDGEPLADSDVDIVQIRVTSEDAKGEFYPYGENRTHFHVTGPATIRALDNGSPIDVEKHFGTTDRIAFYGLTRAYVETTGAEGDVALLASCILGEKKQVTSDKVSIDAKWLALRGNPSTAKTEIFYTIDGSSPSPSSPRYTEPFSVPLGTTVKASIVVDGKAVQTLEERFAEDEGFVWDGGQSTGPVGEQAEDAEYAEANVSANGLGFHGKGYIRFTRNPGGFVQWYQENDGDAGTADLIIRHSGKLNNKNGYELKVSINGKTVDAAVAVPNTDLPGQDWKTVTVEIPIGRGANMIRLTPKFGNGLCIDEILIR
ncbi:beta-galactosidase [Rhodopirellula rubra]|uniref:Beta-galactosidase n=1 Tax=Aporhodopirellula rubra TaxID=980271 RepID=A0A7W5DYE5_9BACT|nr:glycoside hydrolase family 2 TIM barrel-domain containing protein [Aporhodopirellula rubra]MBB3206804.1 beta-galactosidase [Aporhodopirellula rubra]